MKRGNLLGSDRTILAVGKYVIHSRKSSVSFFPDDGQADDLILSAKAFCGADGITIKISRINRADVSLGEKSLICYEFFTDDHLK